MLSQLAVLAVAASTQQSPDNPLDFLLWSMDKYKGIKSLHVEWSVSITGDSAQHTKSLYYVEPNKFDVVYVRSYGAEIYRSISDGKQLFEFKIENNPAVTKYPAPASLVSADSTFMSNPVINGSLLYKFLAGKEGLKGL